jgi:nitroimidazol reductase NimA-like FMN-containing flavoprotein (pyridoxamine 5'-phosphate oxidase superfamily)
MTDRPTSMPEPQFDAGGLEVLPEAECLRLLASKPVGRLVFHEDGLPAVRLVNFVVDGGTVVFRTAGGQAYGVALRGDVVAFEVDEYDVETHLGWTVTAVGHAADGC